jgi:mannose-6-phosphate isomerase
MASRYGRSVSAGKIAESWEISDRADGMSVVFEGPLAGRSLHELVEADPAAMVGNGRAFGVFPLLIKIIDARERLSLQVHPNDESAARFGGEAKTEMWIVLDAAPGAMVHAGFREPTDAAAFRAALEGGRVEELLRAIPVKRGDAIFVPGGRVHCIGAGCLLLEIQQNSNTTYRVHDWGRLGADGKPRELHIEQALRVIHWDDTKNPVVAAGGMDSGSVDGVGGVSEIWSCPYFRVERLRFSGERAFVTDGLSFHAIFVEKGRLRAIAASGCVEAAEGTSILLPASVGEYKLLGSDVELLRTSLP